jgi:hypothetical protein
MLLDLRKVSNVGTECMRSSTVSVELRSIVALFTTVTSAGTSRSFSGRRVAVTTVSSPHNVMPPSADVLDTLTVVAGSAADWPASWPSVLSAPLARGVMSDAKSKSHNRLPRALLLMKPPRDVHMRAR